MAVKSAVAVVVEDEYGNILLTQRGRSSRDELGKWENCGGAVEENETEENAIKREVKEELGCDLQIIEVLYKDTFTTDSGTAWQVTVFKGKLLGVPKTQNKTENAAVKWFKKESLKNLNLATYTRQDFIRFGWVRK